MFNNISKHCFRALFLLYSIIFSSPVYSASLPLWELGLGVGYVNSAIYRGATKRANFLVPYPYFIYRGSRLKVDEEGVRSKIAETPRLKLDFSIAGQVPVVSNKNGPRAGMPRLEPIGEIGPSLEYNLWQASGSPVFVWLRLPWRFVYSFGDPLVKYRGWSFSPYIDLVKYFPEKNNLRLSWAIGPIFSNSQYHDFFYKVSQEYTTPLREQYGANSGYSGSRMTLTATARFKDYWVGAMLRYDDISAAEFEKSPLVTSKNYLIFGVTVAWIFSKSDTRVVD